MLIYTFVHFCNKAINQYTDTNANYMFSIEATNPLTALFYQVIPCEYWYMYLAVPIVAAYLLIVYAPELLSWYRNRKKTRQTASV